MTAHICPFARQEHTPATHGVMDDVKAIILHDTEGWETYDLEIFRTGRRGDVTVGIHFYITEEGVLYQFAPINVGVWHAGRSALPDGTTDVNEHTIGIELEHGPVASRVYSEKQLVMLDRLIAWIDADLSAKKPIYGHKEIAPDRKSDPNGPFPLAKYQRFRTHKEAPVTLPGWYIQSAVFAAEADAVSFEDYCRAQSLQPARCGVGLVFHASGVKLAKAQDEARKRGVAVCVKGQPWSEIPDGKIGVFFTPLATPQTSYLAMK